MFKNKLIDNNLWNAFLQNILDKDFVTDKEKKELKDFISNKKYDKIAKDIYNNNYEFSIPIKHLINKRYNTKKRTVYTFHHDEMIILKYMAYHLYDYDYLFSKNLYSFRKNIGVKNAINSLLYTKNIKTMYGYKLDIKNYFNSIKVNILLDNLRKDLPDTDLINILTNILTNDKVLFNNEIIKENKGAIPGCPISAFLANFYLKDIDNYFASQKIFYIRYADDIIMFANTKEDLLKYQRTLQCLLSKYQLEINHDKEYFYNPGDVFEFLGFSFNKGTIDISQNTLKKIKSKIRRSTRSFRRWMLEKNIKEEVTLKTIINKYNKKFYGKDHTELSWQYWFFPIINTSKSLKIIDKYFEQELRYLITGKHNKRNFKKVPYQLLKNCHYKPLVHEYYLSFNMKNKV